MNWWDVPDKYWYASEWSENLCWRRTLTQGVIIEKFAQRVGLASVQQMTLRQLSLKPHLSNLAQNYQINHFLSIFLQAADQPQVGGFHIVSKLESRKYCKSLLNWINLDMSSIFMLLRWDSLRDRKISWVTCLTPTPWHALQREISSTLTVVLQPWPLKKLVPSAWVAVAVRQT